VLEALQEEPTGSLRRIAKLAGVSPETVRTVKVRLQASPAEVSLPAARASNQGDGDPNQESSQYSTLWASDIAIQTSSDGSRFLEWFSTTAIDDEWERWAQGVPLSRIYDVADEARRRATCWHNFALALQSRAYPQRVS
jgi:hypothetical protein